MLCALRVDGLNAVFVLSKADLTSEDEGRFESEITNGCQGQNKLQKSPPICNSVVNQAEYHG